MNRGVARRTKVQGQVTGPKQQKLEKLKLVKASPSHRLKAHPAELGVGQA